MDLAALGWNDRWAALAADRPRGTVPARVVRHDSSAVLVAGPGGLESVPLRPAIPPVAVGDWLLIGPGRIDAVLERASLLQRRDPSSGGAQLIAANVDLVGIVCGVDRLINTGRNQRMAIQVWDSGATPMIVLNKTDLMADTTEAEEIAARAAPGVEILVISASTGEGIDDVRAAVTGRTVAFVGESGAGKSTLVNTLAGDEVALTGAVRESDAQGRHTTTARELMILPDGGILIDNPGIREVHMWTDETTLRERFADISELAAQCKFHDCKHGTDAGCAIRAALAAGNLAAARYEGFLKLDVEIEKLRQNRKKRQMTLERRARREQHARDKRFSDRRDQDHGDAPRQRR